MRKASTVSIPATSANLGPGFDCLGLALELRNRVTFSEIDRGLEITIRGEGEGSIPTDDRNLVVAAAGRLFDLVGRQQAGLRVVQENYIPVGSGLGSSAAAVLGGLLAANELVDGGLDEEQILTLATDIEGHPDNVAPALYGGLTLIVQEGGELLVDQIALPPFKAIVVLPNFNLPTAAARAALPNSVKLADAVYNASRLALLVRALATGDALRLQVAMGDRLHQPYRLPLIPGMERVFACAEAAGAAIALSGAGPSVIALVTEDHQTLANELVEAFQQAGLRSRHWILPLSEEGYRIGD